MDYETITRLIEFLHDETITLLHEFHTPQPIPNPTLPTPISALPCPHTLSLRLLHSTHLHCLNNVFSKETLASLEFLRQFHNNSISLQNAYSAVAVYLTDRLLQKENASRMAAEAVKIFLKETVEGLGLTGLEIASKIDRPREARVKGSDEVFFVPSAQNEASSSFSSFKWIILGDWWLTISETNVAGKRLAVCGYKDFCGQTTVDVFTSAPIVNIYNPFTIETADGFTLRLQGSIIRSHMQLNGFPLEVSNYFCTGFPYNWEYYAKKDFEPIITSLHTHKGDISRPTNKDLDCTTRKINRPMEALFESTKSPFVSQLVHYMKRGKKLDGCAARIEVKPSTMERNPIACTYQWHENSPNASLEESPISVRVKKEWTSDEEDALRKAVTEFGTCYSAWILIQSTYPEFECRTVESLRRKWRHMNRKGKKGKCEK